MTNYIYFKKKRLIIYIFMIKILFNFKCIYMYELMHVLYASFFLIIWLIIYIFIIKIVFNFNYTLTFVWVIC